MMAVWARARTAIAPRPASCRRVGGRWGACIDSRCASVTLSHVPGPAAPSALIRFRRVDGGGQAGVAAFRSGGPGGQRFVAPSGAPPLRLGSLGEPLSEDSRKWALGRLASFGAPLDRRPSALEVPPLA